MRSRPWSRGRSPRWPSSWKCRRALRTAKTRRKACDRSWKSGRRSSKGAEAGAASGLQDGAKFGLEHGRVGFLDAPDQKTDRHLVALRVERGHLDALAEHRAMA